MSKTPADDLTASSERVCVAVIGGAHGVRGDVRLKSFTQLASDCFNYAPFYDDSGNVLLEPSSWRAMKDGFIVTPIAPRQKEEWDSLRGTLLYVDRDTLPNTDEGEFYVNDLVGLTVRFREDHSFGTVKAVHNFGGDDLLEIIPCADGPSFLLPFTRDDVPDVQIDQGYIVVDPDPAYIDEGDPGSQEKT